MNRCPGYGRPCGVMTPRPLCYFCQKTRELAGTLDADGPPSSKRRSGPGLDTRTRPAA